MALDSPSTYAEWYWKHSLDAAYARSESYEKALSPIAAGLIDGMIDFGELPSYIATLFDVIKSPKAPDLDNVLTRFIADAAGSIVSRVAQGHARTINYTANSKLQNMHITAAVANTLMLRKKVEESFWLNRNQEEGFNEVEAAFAYESQKPYPSIPDIITYARYHGPADNPKELAWSKYDISPIDWEMWEWLSFQKPNLDQIHALYKRKEWSKERTDTELARIGWSVADRIDILNLGYTIPNAMLLTQGGLFQEEPKVTLLDNISIGDIHPDYAELYLDAILTKPAAGDIVAWELRQDINLPNLGKELGKIGIHPKYHQLYKDLAYQIPPVADIITMAVREAFTPEIASLFGQYEGLPEQYVEWVGKKGLSKEWAERYWAAHWTLPSLSQGFEMLHRKIISRDDLIMLMRALDIMPFWRNRLIEMAYTPLTRVDIRRMYNIDVINEAEVFSAYKDIGYNDTNAKRHTLFTVTLRKKAEERLEEREEKARAQQAERDTKERIKEEEKVKREKITDVKTWTSAQTLSFLKKGLIPEERARKELEQLGYTEERILTYFRSIGV